MKIYEAPAELKCDNPLCDWKKQIPLGEIPGWHHQVCPECLDCVLVTNEDLAIAVSLIQGIGDKELRHGRGVVSVRIDTGALRGGGGS